MVLNNKEIIRAVINSEKKLNTSGTETGSNFTFTFNKDITRITEIVVESVQIPYTFYAINALNNVLTFNKGLVKITIPPGNYTTATLSLILRTLINTAFNDTTTNIVFTYASYAITITRGIAFNVDAVKDIPASIASKALGFNISTVTALSVTGNNVINIAGPNYILITSNLLTHPIHHQMLYADNSYTNVLVSMPVDASPGDIINLREKVSVPVKFSYKFAILAGTPIDITITDEFGNILNMNGADVSIQFVFITE